MDRGPWHFGAESDGYATGDDLPFHVVALDFGAKHNILRNLVAVGCRVTVMPADGSADSVLEQSRTVFSSPTDLATRRRAPTRCRPSAV